MRDFVLTLADALLICWVIVAGPFCWLLRDGLGPSAVESHGWTAVGQFLLTFSWGPSLLVLGGLRVVVGKLAKSKRRPCRASQVQLS